MASCQVLHAMGMYYCGAPATAKVCIRCRTCQRQRERYMCATHYAHRSRIHCTECYTIMLTYSEPVSA